MRSGPRSQPECLSQLTGRQCCRPASLEIYEPLQRDTTVLAVDQRFVVLDPLGFDETLQVDGLAAAWSGGRGDEDVECHSVALPVLDLIGRVLGASRVGKSNRCASDGDLSCGTAKYEDGADELAVAGGLYPRLCPAPA